MPALVPSPQDDGAERAMAEVSDVLLNLEHTIARAKKALSRVQKAGVDTNAELALKELTTQLSASHKRLLQDTYYSGDAVRLL